MKLNLKNPIVFFDLETTGTNINSDRIVEICYLKVYPNGNEETKTMRINPEMHIPAEASAVHGIYDEDVADCPTFKEVARGIANDIEGCDLAGFNSNRFDILCSGGRILRADVGYRHEPPQVCGCAGLSSIKWNSARCPPPISSIAARIWNTPIRRKRILALLMRC